METFLDQKQNIVACNLAFLQRDKRANVFLFRFFNVSSYVGSFKVSLLFLARKKSTSSFLASKLGAESFLLRFLGFIKRVKIVENVYDLCQPSMFSTKPGSIFPPWAKPCSRRHESDQNPERIQPKLFSQGDLWAKVLVYLAPIKFKQENKRTVFSLNKQISRNMYLPEFIKRYLQKSQVGFNNFILEVSKKQLKVASYGLKRTN